LCFVEDLIQAFLKIINSGSEIKGPMNLGNPEEITINELASKILLLTGSNAKLIYSDLPVDDPRRRKPDIELARKTLNWEPKTDLSVGLKKTIEYFRDLP
jgi:UDP-glucuronate decarboxylase